jgi:hypothetical protein
MPEHTFIPTREEIAQRWPHIKRYVWVNNSDVCVDDYRRWFCVHESTPPPCPELALAYEEWADYFEWRLTRRADELAADPGKRRVVENWTDSIAYSCRRLAVYARGGDPGERLSPDERAAVS